MTVWNTLSEQLSFMLGIASQVTEANRIVAFNFAQRTFALEHTAKRMVADYTSEDCDSDFVFTLPTGILDIYALYSNDELCFMEEAAMFPGGAWDLEPSDPSALSGVGGLSSTRRPFSFIKWPEGSIKLLFEPDEAEVALRLYYWGHWSEVSDSVSVIDSPAWSYEALLTYAVAMTYVPSLGDASWINEFKTRVDSGNPVQNPHEVAHKKLLEKYAWLLSKHPRQIREYAYQPGGRRR